MKVEVLTIGNEILSGVIVDTNGAWLAGQLYERGVLVDRKTTVLDHVETIAAELKRAARSADLVVVCGGLGPTDDDVTADGAALAAGGATEQNADAARQVTQRIERYGFPVTPRQLRQAQLPASCEVIENRRGTAPAFAMDYGECHAFFLPGPPREFEPLVKYVVLPWVEERLGGPTGAAVTLRCFGLTESRLADLVSEVPGLDDIEIGYRPVFPEIHLRLRATGNDAGDALARCEDAARALETALGEVVYGRDDEGLAAAVGRMLADAGKTLSFAESCTGGLAGQLVTDVPGSSAYFLLSAVTYANEMKTAVLGVPEALLTEHGAVSEAVAIAMAQGVRQVSGSDIAVGITGIAGPGGGTDDKPVGTVCLALCAEGIEPIARTRLFPGTRSQVRRLSAFIALELVRRHLIGSDLEDFT